MAMENDGDSTEDIGEREVNICGNNGNSKLHLTFGFLK
jgi:hypothetical protein